MTDYALEQIQWSPGMTLEALEKQAILKTFRFYRGNKTTTANVLGIAIRTLDNKLEKYELDAKLEKEREENGKSERAQWLERSRGKNTPNFINTGNDEKERAQSVSSANAGVRVESIANTSPQQAVPVSQRQEVQKVLPRDASQSGHHKRR